jgi:hypothetical protein
MAVTTAIPLPETGMDAFEKSFANSQSMFTSFLNNAKNQKFTPYQLELLKAQAEQARAKGQQATMFANLIKSITGGDGGAGGADNQSTMPPNNTNAAPSATNTGVSEGDMNQMQNQQPGQSYVIGSNQPPSGNAAIAPQPNMNDPLNQVPGQGAQPTAAPPAAPVTPSSGSGYHPMTSRDQRANALATMMHLGSAPQVIDGQIVQTNPFTGTSVMKVGMSPREKFFAAQDAKVAEKMNETALAGGDLNYVLDGLHKIVTNPEWSKMRNYSGLGPGAKAELYWYAHNGTPQQQDLANRFITDSGQVVATASKQFSGQFRRGEQSLLENMKANDNDSPLGAQAKVEALQGFTQFMTKRRSLATNYIRQGMTPSDAIDRADRELNGSLVDKIMETKLAPHVAANDKTSGLTKPSVIKPEHITEANIQATMKARGKTRDEVIANLRAQGLMNGS